MLYIDIDVHHGDGVEEAFLTTGAVLWVPWLGVGHLNIAAPRMQRGYHKDGNQVHVLSRML